MIKARMIAAFTIAFSACDTLELPEQTSTQLSKTFQSEFNLSDIGVSLSPTEDLDPNSDCSFIENITAVGRNSVRILQQNPDKFCLSGKEYRTCTLVSIASLNGLALDSQPEFTTTLTFKPAKNQTVSLKIETLAIINNLPRQAMNSITLSNEFSGSVNQKLITWHNANTIITTYKLTTTCAPNPDHDLSTLAILSAKIVN